MRSGFGMAVLCAVAMAWAACQCGGKPCTTNNDCSLGEVCGPAGTCVPDNGNGDGGDGGDGGNDAGQDAGRLPDGGTCVNLQCRQVTCTGGGTTSLTGSVYDPSGQVALYNAIVYVPNSPLKPLPTGLSCDQCGSLVSGNPVAITLTGPDGKFKLDNVPVGPNIPLVIQVGKWRRTFTVPFNVQQCTSQPITDVSLLHLPRDRNEGDIPQMAIATGNADPFECLLLKMGINTNEMTAPVQNGGGRIHFYWDPTNNNRHQGGLKNATGYGDVLDLIGDAGTMSKYDVVLLPCIGSEKFGSSPNTTQQGWTQNLINYTGSGGRLFTTHFGYVWMAYAQQPFRSTALWTPHPVSSAPPSPFTVDVNQGFPKGAAFAQWLWDAGASTTFAKLDVEETRHDCSGTDGGTTTWLSGTNPNVGGGTYTVQHLTFNTPYNPPPFPDGDAGTQCGRVVFSDFHVTAGAFLGTGANGQFPHDCAGGATTPMTPQEKALVFMLFDVSSCVQNDNTAPQVCKSSGGLCARDTDCCNGLACVDANQLPCFEGSCSCQVVIN